MVERIFLRRPPCWISTIRTGREYLFSMERKPRPRSLINTSEMSEKNLSQAKERELASCWMNNSHPTRDRMLRSLKEQFPQVKFYSYEPLSFEERDAAINSLFGPDVAIRPAFANADIIVSLDCDFLGSEQTLQGVRDFSRRRRVQGSVDSMNRLYAVENRFTITGGMADHRFRCAASQVPAFALQLAKKVVGSTNDRVLGAVVAQFSETGTQFDDAWLTECANDLVARKGRSLILAGNRFPAWVHSVVFAMNGALGAFGSTLTVLSVPRVKAENLGALVADAKSHALKKLFVLSGNPVYTAPADLDWSVVQRSIPEVVRLGYSMDETSAEANWHVPEAHFLESWGDQRALDGTYLPIQPMILPLFGGLSQIDILSKMTALPNGVQAVRDTFKSLTKESDFEAAWTKFLRNGFAEQTLYETAKVELNPNALPELLKTAGSLPGPVTPSAIEVVFPADYKVYDGRYTNNAWLQELPDPITKLTWDNAVLLSKSTAKALQVDDGDVIEISVGERKLQAPVMIAPGHADYSLSLSLGYGRRAVGRIGRDTGFNAYELRTTNALYYATRATVKLIQKKGHQLVQTQNHYTMEGRALVREGTVEDYRKNAGFAKDIWIGETSQGETPRGDSRQRPCNPPRDSKDRKEKPAEAECLDQTDRERTLEKRDGMRVQKRSGAKNIRCNPIVRLKLMPIRLPLTVKGFPIIYTGPDGGEHCRRAPFVRNGLSPTGDSETSEGCQQPELEARSYQSLPFPLATAYR